MAVGCVRLGFWQLSRWHEKQAMNAALERDLAAPPVSLDSGESLPEPGSGKRVRVRGRFDERRQILLTGRLHEGTPGVEIVTPLVLAGDSTAVLVNRGWVESPDAMTARVGDYPEPGEREVVGVIGRREHGAAGAALEPREQDGAQVWLARRVDLDSIAPRLPYRLVPAVIVQLPGDQPSVPIRSRPAKLNESLHLGYAIQWFCFAAIALGGLALAFRRRQPPGP